MLRPLLHRQTEGLNPAKAIAGLKSMLLILALLKSSGSLTRHLLISTVEMSKSA